MAYYIIYFDGAKVIDVSKYSENEYDEYIYRRDECIRCNVQIQFGYF